MLEFLSRISRRVRSKIASRGVFLGEGIRSFCNKESIAIPSDANLSSFRIIEEINDGSEARISELIATRSFRITGMVRVQSFTPA